MGSGSTEARGSVGGWLRYWRASLAEGQLAEIDAANDPKSEEVTLDQIRKGILPKRTARALFRSSKRREPHAEGDGEDRDERTFVSVLLSPVVFGRRKPGRHVEHVNPFLIPAVLTREGLLKAPDQGLPWFPRTLLEPAPEGQKIIFGSVAALDRALVDTAFKTHQGQWYPYRKACEAVFEEVTGQSLEDCEKSGWRRVEHGFVLPLDGVSGMSQHILRLYDRLIDRGRRPPVTAALTAGATSQGPGLGQEGRLLAALDHVGEIPREFPLEPSQRKVLRHSLYLRKGEILAANGPPGTGKSTLLQSVAASWWVRSALLDGAPSLVLMTSTNNRAILSVLQKVAQLPADGEAFGLSPLLTERWLPDLPSYGLFCSTPTPRVRRRRSCPTWWASSPRSVRRDRRSGARSAKSQSSTRLRGARISTTRPSPSAPSTPSKGTSGR